MFVPSLSWQNDRFYIKMAPKCRLSQADVWYLEDRQPEIIVNNCEHAMASDPQTGMVYWGHPGALNMTRANYTVHQSSDGMNTCAQPERFGNRHFKFAACVCRFIALVAPALLQIA
jgi:hypothetical protein